MRLDATEIPLTPGNHGEDCLGNGKHEGFDCCCDECDYLMCCTDPNWAEACKHCDEEDCERIHKSLCTAEEG